ncbi:MAG: helix-turn-helix transcriptional regulator [Spirochaetia bacterium]|nr:helix-turn-helix transcriptional regulator [Spirochaetia bacterium]
MNLNNSLRGCRPYPIDKDRQNRCMSVLNDAGMTISELADCIGMKRPNVSNIISGRELTESGETKIARFLGYQRTDLFPLRTNQQIADMRVAEQKRKQALAEKKNARMLRKTGAA